MYVLYFLSFKTLMFAGILLLFGCKSNSKGKDEVDSGTQSLLRKPNILFVLVDDLGNHDLGISGSAFYETPNVDGLAKQSMIFTNGYAASSVCSPSRASIMTGKFTARHGITDWIGAKVGTAWRTRNRHNKLLPAEYICNLPKNELTLAEVMKNSGYKTYFAGKWHLGDEGSLPEDHGFEINKGGFHAGSPAGGYFSPWDNPKLTNKQKGENLTLRLAFETAQFIKENKDVPFFAFLSFYAVHAPLQTSEIKWKKYRDKAEKMAIAETGYKMERDLPIRVVQDNPVYGALVETMDDAVGIVLGALEANGVADNTIVVFTSDNGGVASGDHYATSNLPLRGGKGYQWEGGIREPFFIKVPWLNNTGSKTEFPVINTDFYPTLLDLADLPLLPQQHADGINLKPLLEGKDFKIERPLFWHYPHYGNQGGEPTSIIQSEGWKLIHYWEDGREELFKLPSTEKDELNIISEYPEIAKELSEHLISWLIEVGARFPEKDTEYDKVEAEKRKFQIENSLLPSLERERLELLSKGFLPNQNWWKSKLIID
ncbi:sulfatase [Namhaeicola litoreus]|uniref:Sulfatase n=1 Tax=Namhaeicola litoreus TaxID=1052145 RepID=A0ABW3Y734_9FLAO